MLVTLLILNSFFFVVHRFQLKNGLQIGGLMNYDERYHVIFGASKLAHTSFFIFQSRFSNLIKEFA